MAVKATDLSPGSQGVRHTIWSLWTGMEYMCTSEIYYSVAANRGQEFLHSIDNSRCPIKRLKGTSDVIVKGHGSKQMNPGSLPGRGTFLQGFLEEAHFSRQGRSFKGTGEGVTKE